MLPKSLGGRSAFESRHLSAARAEEFAQVGQADEIYRRFRAYRRETV
jgi:hypothetical protein